MTSVRVVSNAHAIPSNSRSGNTMPKTNLKSKGKPRPAAVTQAKGAQSITMREVESLVPYSKNPRTHNEAQVKAIAKSIQRFGFTNPILLDGASNIIAGHGRLAAAISLGLKSVPCIDLHGMTPEEKRAYIIADNQLALQAGWDMQILAAEIQQLAVDGMDVSLLGFSEKEMDLIERLGASWDEQAAQPGSTIGGDRFLLMLEFDNESDQQKAFSEFTERGMRVKVLQ